MSALDTPAVGKRENGPFSWLRQGAERLLLSQYLVLILTAVYFLAVWPIVPQIAERDTLLDILTAMMPLLVVAGIRPAGAAAGDQRRTGTPAEAIRAGASILVIGRPLRDAPDPAAAADAIAREIAQ